MRPLYLLIYLVLIMWTFIAGARLYEWRLLHECGEAAIWAARSDPAYHVGGGCVKLLPMKGVYEIRRVDKVSGE